MTLVEIIENEYCSLNDESAQIASRVKKIYPKLPFNLEGNKLSFDQYTVGELRLGKTIIRIKPRHSFIKMKDVFEMATFNNSSHRYLDLNIPTFSENTDYGISPLYQQFVSAVDSLLNYGITPTINTVSEYSNSVSGNIDFKCFNVREFPFKGIKSSRSEQTLNNIANQLIKSAAKKLILTSNDPVTVGDLNLILRNFTEVDEIKHISPAVENRARNFYSSNVYYLICIELSLIILKEIKLSYGNEGYESHAFLENSNSLFEDFVLNALKISLSHKVEKWSSGKPYASLRRGNQNFGLKSYLPDILLDYNPKAEQAKAIFDAKNKALDHNRNKISESISPADIYQILFYCSRLKSRLGGLIYPSGCYEEPYKLCLADDREINIFILFVSMECAINERIKLLCNDIKNAIDFY